MNTNLVVVEDGSLHAAEHFSHLDGDAVAQRSVKPALLEMDKRGELLAVLQAVPEEISEEYEVVHRGFSDVLLQPLNRLWHYSVVADPADLKENSRVQAAHAVYKALLGPEGMGKARGSLIATWQLDTRFRGRVYAKKMPTDTWGKGT